MSKVTDSIGLKFERQTQQIFPELEYTGGDSNIPDFYHPRLGFWVEAKVGNLLWGVRIKRNQIEKFREIEKPIIYFVGLHDFDDANRRLVQKTERGRQKCLDDYLSVHEMHFITKELMDKFWARENRRNQKETIEYCMIKKSTLSNIYFNRNFERDGKTKDVKSFYGFNPEDFLISPPRKNKKQVPYGAMLSSETDKEFIKYLETKGFELRL